MARPILCCGEALIDLVPARAGSPELLPRPGGAALNCAISLARLGQRAALVAGISTDPFGEALIAALEADGVETNLLIRSDLPSTLAAVHLRGGDAAYSFHDTATAGREIAPADLPTLPEAAALVFGGISLARAPSAQSFLQIAETAQATGPVLLDPNIRPGLIDDPHAYRSTLRRAMRAADILKVSEEDLAWLGGPPLGLLELGPRLILLTRGAAGVTALTRDGETHVPAPAADVVDTVGAGDTFTAGFLTACAEGAGLEAALSFACRAASLSVSRPGAAPPYRSEL